MVLDGGFGGDTHVVGVKSEMDIKECRVSNWNKYKKVGITPYRRKVIQAEALRSYLMAFRGISSQLTSITRVLRDAWKKVLV